MKIEAKIEISHENRRKRKLKPKFRLKICDFDLKIDLKIEPSGWLTGRTNDLSNVVVIAEDIRTDIPGPAVGFWLRDELAQHNSGEFSSEFYASENILWASLRFGLF